MADARLEDIRNFREVDGRLATGGQPSAGQLAAARSAGVEVVINLALHDDPRYSLPDERATVESLGMTYRHIPVQFGAPTESDLLAFFDAMEAAQGRHVLVHCALTIASPRSWGCTAVCVSGCPSTSRST
jgi:protein tyrosine phosphatase (PTP) superfamily phosphohydrolase (DUF442 family)